jgi:hypothetical protein
LFVLDGHQRDRVLRRLKAQGYSVPALPIAFIEAKDEAEARKKILLLSSQCGEMSEVIRFLTGCEQSGVELFQQRNFFGLSSGDCLPHIREWMLRGKNEKYRGSDTIHGKREKANHDYCLQGCSAAEPRAD